MTDETETTTTDGGPGMEQVLQEAYRAAVRAFHGADTEAERVALRPVVDAARSALVDLDGHDAAAWRARADQ